MSVPVFNVDNIDLPFTEEIEFATVVADFGDGFEQRKNNNLAYSRADGLGGVTSYKGRNRFTMVLDNMQHVNADATKTANMLWAFYVARLGSYEAFYIYRPCEASIDLTGASTTGRYLVRFEQNRLSRSQFALKLFNAQLTLVEVRA